MQHSKPLFAVAAVVCALLAGVLSCQQVAAPPSQSGTPSEWPSIYTIEVDSLAYSPDVAVGDTLIIRFWGYVGPDTCHEFWQFSTFRDSFTVRIEVIGVQYFESSCADTAQYLEGEPLRVAPLHAGDLMLFVVQPDGSALVETVRVADRALSGARPN